MNRGIYAAATAMQTSQRWLDVVTNNLSNANTTGYKRDVVAFNDTYVRELRAQGGAGEGIGSMGSGMYVKGEGTIRDKGAIFRTNNPLDLAIEMDHGMFAIETPQGVRYTRDGAFSLNSAGQMVNNGGGLVLSDRGTPITLPPGQIEINSKGEILVGGRTIATVGVFDGSFQKQGSNLYTSSDASVLSRDDVELRPMSLEGSNVNAIDAMVEMISLQRGFEMAQRTVLSEDEASQRLIQSLQR